MASQPLIAIVGATGAQGSSVLSTYLNTTSWRIRALTRSASSSKAKALTERSSRIEVAEANLNDIASLRKAFEGAIAIFGVTDFWTLISDESNKAKVKDGQSFAEWGAEMEVQQGKNIFEAANQVSSLKRLVFSSLTDITKWSGAFLYSHTRIGHELTRIVLIQRCHDRWKIYLCFAFRQQGYSTQAR